MATYFDIWRKQYRRLPSVGREGLSTAIEGEEKGEDVEVKFPITPRTSRTKKIVYTVVVLILWLTTAGLFGVAAPHVKKKLDEPSFFPESKGSPCRRRRYVMLTSNFSSVKDIQVQ